MKHIKEVYDKYKHLDHLLSDEEWMMVNNTAIYLAACKMWQAIKKTVEESSETTR